MKTEIPTIEELTEAGFQTAAYEMEGHKQAASPELRAKLRIAFEHFRVVEPQHVERFNEHLKTTTKKRCIKRDGGYHKRDLRLHTSYLQLKLTAIHNYLTPPPKHVLEDLQKARALKCFDRFVVATLDWKTEIQNLPKIEDPILFGIVEGSDNLYFISQWDNDIKIEDILKEGEG